MNSKTKTLLAGLGLALLTPLAVAQYRYMNIPETIQEHSNWCWAASSKAIISYYRTPPSQCFIANWALGIDYACGNDTFDWDSFANQPNAMYGTTGSAQAVLSAFGVATNAYAYASSWNTVVRDTNYEKPFMIRFGWTAGGGHLMVGLGYEFWNGSNYVIYMNPWPGEGFSEDAYSWMVSASDHKWTHTLRVR